MRIALIGAQGTGKTTILNELKNEPLFNNYEFITEVVRHFHKHYNIPISEKSTDVSQLIYFNKYFEILNLNENFVSDRSLIDVLSYTLYVKDKIPKYVTDYMFKIIEQYIIKYDYIFYFPIMFPVSSDGVRSNDKTFQRKIDSIMNSVIEYIEGKIPNIKIYTISQLDIKDRVNFILSTINN